MTRGSRSPADRTLGRTEAPESPTSSMRGPASSGGGGLVGSSTAYALQCAGIVDEIALVDVNAAKVAGEALDLLHGSSLIADQRIVAAGYETAARSDVVIITAGLRRKPDESRLDLINRNVTVFSDVLGQLKSARLREEAIVFVVSNHETVQTNLCAAG